jgi:galactokinase
MVGLAYLAAEVRSQFRDPNAVTVSAAPGRVNLIGEHTDYNDGFCLPMAIDRWCVVGAGPPGSLQESIGYPNTDYNDGFVLPVALDRECVVVARPTADGRVRARSADVPGAVDVAADGSDDPRGVEPPWGRFVAGAVHAVAARGAATGGVDLAVRSTVPIGSGLSSSSALAVASVLALADLGGLVADRVELAQVALDAEVAATGVPGGLMDQLCSLYGRADHALLIDCRALTVEPVPLPPGIAWLVVHSGMPRVLAGSEYAARRAECEEVAARLGLASLRDATPEQVAGEPRARHVVAENARVLAAVDALRRNDLATLGALLRASHASLRDDYNVSTPALDLLVELLEECGAAGARLTGAGFGGCVVACVQRNHADDVAAKATLRYRERTGLEPFAFVARAVDGAELTPL